MERGHSQVGTLVPVDGALGVKRLQEGGETLTTPVVPSSIHSTRHLSSSDPVVGPTVPWRYGFLLPRPSSDPWTHGDSTQGPGRS